MARQIRHKSKNIGLSPGSLVFVGEKRTEKTTINVIDYNETACDEKELKSMEECAVYRDSDTKSWINITGLDNVKLFEKMGEIFEIHPLVLEDILNTEQRPKLEDFDRYLFLVFKIFYFSKDQNEIESEQVSVIF